MAQPPGGSSPKVRIEEQGEASPLLKPNDVRGDEHFSNSKQHRASLAKRLTGRSSYKDSTTSVASQDADTSASKVDGESGGNDGHRVPRSLTASPGAHHSHGHLASDVFNWLEEQKAKRSSSEPQGIDLEGLEQILKSHMHLSSKTPDKERPGSYFPRKRSSVRPLRKKSTAGSSDTEYLDGDAVVPSVEAVLDNSKAMSYSGGNADPNARSSSVDLRRTKEKDAWLAFKSEIVRLAHTLRLKGWRRVPLERGGEISVERLSGALTNAVYVVAPPKNLVYTPKVTEDFKGPPPRKRSPPKLLLRVYGPQVEHLIDREAELQILRRLARKKIGPRLLGTFENGRFEEFFHAKTLTYDDLRIPETSKQIAKRMRELHDGIELLQGERDAGPTVWRNWDKWVSRCEQVISWVDEQILSQHPDNLKSSSETWRRRGLVCGVEWKTFRKAVDDYRHWLDKQYGGPMALREELVFAHNDTQYGNLLRLEPSGESPLLMPSNEHKQLVVIDFEYASANTRGLEFANHFTEWCYNYHNSQANYACNTTVYPTVVEQQRFFKAYVQHRPQFHSRASATPATTANPGPSSSIASFMLDSRAPQTSSYAEDERQREQVVMDEVNGLLRETKLWRVANHAHWVAWGIVQAKIDGLPDGDGKSLSQQSGQHASSPIGMDSDPVSLDTQSSVDSAHSKRPEGLVAEALADGNEMSHDEDDEEEFDYLGYAQERAMFFWGDVVSMGLVRKEDLPQGVVDQLKIVDY